MYSDMLDEMVLLLMKSGDPHWAKWFRIAQELYLNGQESRSFSKVLGAYGGMGSFNDVFWNLPKDEFDRLEHLKGAIWTYARERS